jgi:hypothetical protein
MKKVSLLFVALIVSLIGYSQSEFETAMRANIDSLYRSFGSGAVQKPINTFERLSQVDSNRWEPLYYAAYGYCMLSLKESDNNKKDALCDRGQDLLTKALKKSPGESELYVMQGFLYNMRLIVNPMMRANQYMGLINASYATAEKLDSLNPRTYFMRAQMVMNMPAFMGGGKDKALPVFQKAKQKFDTFTSNNILCPRWGKDECLKKIVECGG